MASSEAKTPIRTAIVEDDPALRKMLVSLVQADPDYTVVAAFAEGRAALAAFAQAALDIVLVDIGLPDMSGIEVIRESERYSPDCNVLVITAFGGRSEISTARLEWR